MNSIEDSVWTNLGPRPGADEIEVAVIGPGHGEAVVVHLGQGDWMLVDSCADPNEVGSRAAALAYLRALGVDANNAVKRILVTHWDDDHVRGIAEVVEACPLAEFWCATALTQREFLEFVEEIGTGATSTDGANVSNLRRVYRQLCARRQTMKTAVPNRLLHESPTIKTWSPSDYDLQKFLEFVAENKAKHSEGQRRAVPGSPNLTSVVVTIDWNHASVLLGADMLYSPDNRRGWSAIVTETKRGAFKKCELVKIPHHGSHTGHDPQMWNEMLTPTPVSIIAPFGRGPADSRPPTSNDLRRINSLSSECYLTANHRSRSRARMNPAVRRSLRENGIRLMPRDRSFGMVRFRKSPDDDWRCDLFGNAKRTK